MPKIDVKYAQSREGIVSKLRTERLPWWRIWRELADFYLPRRYVWLMSKKEQAARNYKNPNILDGTGTSAARILASGMMNGITSPSRPWFKLRVPGGYDESHAARVWLDEVERRMLLIMAESNFYNALATMYLDLCIFGTAATLIYEDRESVIRCYNPPLGEYYLDVSFRGNANLFAREFTMTLRNLVERFGKDALPKHLQQAYDRQDSQQFSSYTVFHLIQPHDPKALPQLSKRFRYAEMYWLPEQISKGEVLSLKGFNEMPGIFPRWDANPGDSYGGSPAMDALGDVIQLQHDTKRKGQALDKLVSPPVIADIQLQHKPTALMPNGVTYVANVGSTQGVKPIYTVNPPLGEMTQDNIATQTRIRETFHNPLFNMISQLNTVRSATEIDARREEKLVLLGPVLERFENEALDPAIERIFSIMNRLGLLPEVPEELAGVDLEIQYISFLSIAQRAVSTAPVERWLTVIAQTASIYPGALDLPDFDQLLLNYGKDIGVSASGMRDSEGIAASRERREAPQQIAQSAAIGSEIAKGAEALSQAEVGGGQSVLSALVGQ